ncbi:hypothetical protein [Ideonella paludis]|uniref:Fibronectin type-III domain-containing protein n=1 Tax=Ideonella paludis TaxID=1233411 RepID=A0ABS5DSZ7_9BURK|nr:hypothetical protein [Ideonella paludis]MBQ0934268.1 hypothetical protein [Ideonella paludis]
MKLISWLLLLAFCACGHQLMASEVGFNAGAQGGDVQQAPAEDVKSASQQKTQHTGDPSGISIEEYLKHPFSPPYEVNIVVRDSQLTVTWKDGSPSISHFRLYKLELNGLKTLIKTIPYDVSRKKGQEILKHRLVVPLASPAAASDFYLSQVSNMGKESNLIGVDGKSLPGAVRLYPVD